MDHELAYERLCEQMHENLERIKDEELVDPLSGWGTIIFWLTFMILGYFMSQFFESMSFSTFLEEVIFGVIGVVVIVFIALITSVFVLSPFTKMHSAKKKLLERIEKEVLLDAQEEAYQQAKRSE